MHIASPILPHSVGLVTAAGTDAPQLLHRLSTQHMLSLPCGPVLAGSDEKLPTGSVASRPLLLVNHQGRLEAQAVALATAGQLALATRPDGAAALCAWLLRYTISEDADFSVAAEQMPCWRLLTRLPGPLAAVGPERQPPDLQPVAWQRVAEALAQLGATWWPVPHGWGEGFDVVLPDARLVEARATLAGLGLLFAPDDLLLSAARLLVGEPAWGTDCPHLAPPLEWRLGRGTIDWHKGCFVGQEVLSRLESYNKVARLVMGVEANDAALQLLQQGRTLKVFRDGEPVGKVSSFAALPGLGAAGESKPAAIALALIRRQAAVAGPCKLADSEANAAPVQLPATLVDRPFWQ